METDSLSEITSALALRQILEQYWPQYLPESYDFQSLNELCRGGAKIVSFIFLGKYGQNVLICTSDNRLFGLGRNENGLLGLGHQMSITTVMEIREMRGKKILQISHSTKEVLVKVDSDFCYGWGRGCGPSLPTPPIRRPTKYNFRTIGHLSGQRHKVSLNKDNEVILFRRCSENSPDSVKFNEQCSTLSHFKPFYLKNLKIREVASGSNHVLLLDYDGLIYSCGENSWGQLGYRTTSSDINQVNVVPTGSVRFNKIYARSNFSIAFSNNNPGSYYIWGEISGESGPVYQPRCVEDPIQCSLFIVFMKYSPNQSLPHLFHLEDPDQQPGNPNTVAHLLLPISPLSPSIVD